MKKLKRISLSDVKVMDAQEMKMILGGSGSGSEGGGDLGGGFDGTGVAKSCSDHKTKEGVLRTDGGRYWWKFSARKVCLESYSCIEIRRLCV